jgi:DNA-binding TFAR19-related protein (PDSD5 family)
MKEEELTSLLVAHRLASAIPDSMLKKILQVLSQPGIVETPPCRRIDH